MSNPKATVRIMFSREGKRWVAGVSLIVITVARDGFMTSQKSIGAREREFDTFAEAKEYINKLMDIANSSAFNAQKLGKAINEVLEAPWQ